MGTQNLANIASVFIDTDVAMYKTYGENSLSPKDYNELTSIIPTLKTDLDIIYNYLNGQLVYEEESDDEEYSTGVFESQQSTMIIPEELEENNDDDGYEYIGTDDEGNEIYEYHDDSEEEPEPEINEEIPDEEKEEPDEEEIVEEKEPDVFTYTDQFDSSNDSILHIHNILVENKGDVIKSIGPNMSANDIIKMAMVRWHEFVKTKYNSLGNGVKEIFIMEAVAAHPSENIKEIQERIYEKYQITVDKRLVSAVKNKRCYKDIFTRFEGSMV